MALTENALYKTYSKNQNECSVYKSKPRKKWFKRILWNGNLDATWFQLEIDQETEEVKKYVEIHLRQVVKKAIHGGFMSN